MITIEIVKNSDISWVVDVAATRMLVEELNKPDYINPKRLLELVSIGQQNNSMWVAKRNGEPVGALGALPIQNMFNPNISCLSEIFWWIDPKYRGSKAGLMLLYAFLEKAEYYDESTLSLLTTSPVLTKALEKRGYLLREFGFYKGK